MEITCRWMVSNGLGAAPGWPGGSSLLGADLGVAAGAPGGIQELAEDRSAS